MDSNVKTRQFLTHSSFLCSGLKGDVVRRCLAAPGAPILTRPSNPIPSGSIPNDPDEFSCAGFVTRKKWTNIPSHRENQSAFLHKKRELRRLPQKFGHRKSGYFLRTHSVTGLLPDFRTPQSRPNNGRSGSCYTLIFRRYCVEPENSSAPAGSGGPI